MIKKIINSNQNKRRLIRFNMLRKHLCPLCDSIVYFNTKENIFMCKNVNCNFKEEKDKTYSDEILNNF